MSPPERPKLSSLTKVVLHVWSDGTCSLLTVPIEWLSGQVVPEGTPEERYDTPEHAMSALAEAGREQNPNMSWYRDPMKRVPLADVPEATGQTAS